jgi:hypothetical protein
VIIEATLLLWILYIIGIQYKRKGWWYSVLPFTFVALVLDVILNYTVFAVLTLDFPKKREYTFSSRLERLIHKTNWQGRLADLIATYLLDPFDPAGFHIDRKKYGLSNTI